MTNTTPRIREGTDFRQDPLWQRIEAFQPDDPTAPLPFSRKLARENDWNERFTSRAITEYRRFVYLCCISPTGASPSYVIDQVWHKHLLYTENYWDEFCEKVLGRKLHHHPSKGGPPEREKHDDWFRQTLRLYRTVFDESPPPDIWYNTPRSPRKRLRSRFFPRLLPLLLFLSLLLTGCTPGETVFGLIVLALLAYNTARKSAKNQSDGDSSGSACGGGSSCGSSCSSSCGGGCGGCGGGGGD
ncbi:hypothetical protein HF329_06570 [Chitinophaga oryzae]|uniref:TIGR04222 domain-containing membrane protein n=1 Tax=Chitinophaga oryzae TaxID=2725414 RepID=A0AAE6ZDM4_9BACT|nr:hypothetical protein [Chitinophaga oryzae]QJB30983.1 hypothetical protein HF329_06570 [Chitinophaga oryzae]